MNWSTNLIQSHIFMCTIFMRTILCIIYIVFVKSRNTQNIINKHIISNDFSYKPIVRVKGHYMKIPVQEDRELSNRNSYLFPKYYIRCSMFIDNILLTNKLNVYE